MTVTTTEESTGGSAAGPDVPTSDDTPTAPLVTTELLVEDVSIDGMCGVY